MSNQVVGKILEENEIIQFKRVRVKEIQEIFIFKGR